jgi:ABC-type Fe3+ transport system permease subunit
LYPAALALAALLNLVMLPSTFHLLREYPKRRRWLHLIGMAGGAVSPTLAAPAWCTVFEAKFPLRGLCALNPLEQSFEPALSLGFSIVGLIAGFCCAGLFNRHGDRASIFDVNAALDALRQQEPR